MKGVPSIWSQMAGLLEHQRRQKARFAKHGDDRVTVRQARAALAEASCWLPLYPYGRRPGGMPRIRWWRMCLRWASKDKDFDAFIPPLCAQKIRESFGVDGRKKGRKTPAKPRAKRTSEVWPC